MSTRVNNSALPEGSTIVTDKNLNNLLYYKYFYFMDVIFYRETANLQNQLKDALLNLEPLKNVSVLLLNSLHLR